MIPFPEVEAIQTALGLLVLYLGTHSTEFGSFPWRARICGGNAVMLFEAEYEQFCFRSVLLRQLSGSPPSPKA